MAGFDGFDLFVEGMFDQYDALRANPNREFVIYRCRQLIRLLRNYPPANDDEEINVEVFIEMFEELVGRAGG